MNIKINFLAKKNLEKNKEKFFEKEFFLSLKEKFLTENEEKTSNFLNNIFWFIKKIKISNSKGNFYHYKKWSIVYVDFGINIGTEINGKRPSLVFKNNYFLGSEDVLVIPLTSFDEDKFIDKTDLILKKESFLNMKKDSILKISKMKSVSKKRISEYGDHKNILISKPARLEISGKIKLFFGL